MYSLILIDTLTSFRITREKSLRACLEGVFYSGLIDKGRATSNLGTTIPWAEVIGQIIRERGC